MKNLFKKGLAVILTVTMLLSASALSIFAESFGQEISVGGVVSSEEYGDSLIELVFVPDETGLYCFYSVGDVDTVGFVMDTEYNVIAEGDDYEGLNFYINCYMTAGETYILASMPYDFDGSLSYYSVCLDRSDAPIAEEIFIYHGGETMGYVDGYLTLECMGDPEEAYVGYCYWESDNEEVAVIDYSYGSFCDIYFCGEGTATITVTTEFGYTDSVVVKGSEIPEIKLDSPEYLSFGVNGGTRYFTFTPDKTAEYALYTEGSFINSICFYDSDFEYVSSEETFRDSGDVVIRATLKKSETYYIEVASIIECSDFFLYLTECGKAESVKIVYEQGFGGGCKGYRGMTLDLEAIFAPDTAVPESVTWESSNEDVAMIFEGSTYLELMFIDVGKADITVTSAGGLTDTITVECLQMEEINLNEEVTVTNPADGVLYVFSPDHDGVYEFSSSGDAYAVGAVVSDTWYVMDLTLGLDPNFAIQDKMLGGNDYYLITASLGRNEPYTVKVVECEEATSVSLSCGEEIHAYVGEYMTVEPVFGGNNPIIDNCYYLGTGSAIEIDYYENICDIYFLEAGEATLLITTDSGNIATCKIYVEELCAEEILLNEEKTVTLGKYANAYFSFTPEEDGVYSFVSSGDIDSYVFLTDWDLYEYDYDDDSGEGYNFCYQLEMQAGEEYVFKTSYYEPYTDGDTYTVKMVKSTPAEKMILSEEETVSVPVGSLIDFVPEFLPSGALKEEVYFRVSDRSVIEVFMDDGHSCTVIVNGEGIAILEAYTDSGLYAEVTLICGDAVTLGDINGDGYVTGADSNLLKRHIGGNDVDIVELNCDINGDGFITSVDSNLLKRMIAAV